MRIVIATDSFKDALPAREVCRAIAAGIRRRWPESAVIEFPLADGGEGTLEVLCFHLGLSLIEVAAVDPLRRPLTACYGLARDGRTAVIEMARAAGLQLLARQERNPLRTTSFGLGSLLADAERRGAGRILLAIGGSATSDGGVGMAAALGWEFLDAEHRAVEPVGGALYAIEHVVPPRTPFKARVDVMCDVTNVLCGPHGAAQVYGPQKGADAAAVEILDRGLRQLAERVEALLGRPGLAEVPGAGAAGGMGFGAMAFLDAALIRGIDCMLDMTAFEHALKGADLVITGEGALDEQTLHGKLIEGICRHAAGHRVPVAALCGRLSASADELKRVGVAGAWSINDEELPLAQMLATTTANLERAAAKLPLESLIHAG